MALIWQAAASPEESCEWMKMGSETSDLERAHEVGRGIGPQRPAMSLIAIESQPNASISIAWATKVAVVWTGLVV